MVLVHPCLVARMFEVEPSFFEKERGKWFRESCCPCHPVYSVAGPSSEQSLAVVRSRGMISYQLAPRRGVTVRMTDVPIPRTILVRQHSDGQ